MPRALITGMSGFTGGYMKAELVNAGFDVYGTVHNDSAPTSTQLYEVDLCDLKSLRKVVLSVMPDVVIHLAAKSFVGHENVEEVYKTNIIGTRNLLQSLSELERTPKSVLLVSSGNVYGSASGEALSEIIIPKPVNDYAVSKLAMEQMAKLWMDKLPIIIVRPFNYTGIGQSAKFIIPKIVQHYREEKKEIELGNIDISRDFLDVRSVAMIYRMILEKGCYGKIINVCSGKSVSIRQILSILSEISGHTIRIKIDQKFKRKNEIQHLCGSNVLLNNTIGGIELITMRETLKHMYEN